MANFQRTYTNFGGGLNLQLPPVLPDTEEAMVYLETCENWQPSGQGLLKSLGFSSLLASAISGSPKITGLFSYKNALGVSELIICAGTKIYKLNGTATTELKSGQTADCYYQALKWDNGSGTEVLILLNGTDTPVAYDGSTCAAITFTDPSNIWANAKPFAAAVFRGNIFYIDANKVYKPRPGTYNNFDNSQSTVDAFNVDPGFGGKLTGIKALTDDFMVIYKERCIRRLSGSTPFGSTGDPFELRPVTDEFGCIAPRSLVQVALDHYFLSEDGLRQLRPIQSYGDVDPSQPTYPIQSVINGLNLANDAAIQNACAVFDRDTRQVWLSVPNGSSATNNLVIVYDVLSNALHLRKEDDIQAGCWGVYNRRLVHGNQAGQIFQHGNANGNDGSPMTATAESKWLAHLGLGTWKRYQDIFLYADADGAGDVIVQWQLLRRGQVQSKSSTESISTGSNSWDSGVWDTAVWSAGEQNVFHIKNPGRGNAIKLRLINTSSSQRVKIRQIDITGEAFSRRLG